MSSDLTLYSIGTPNGKKITVLLEVLGLKYQYKRIDLSKRVQKEDWFLKLNPNGQIPVITDKDKKGNDVAIFETGAILLYLADTYDRQRSVSYSSEDALYWSQIKWLFYLVSSHSPLQSQLSYFLNFAPKEDEFAIEKYATEVKRIYGVYNLRLSENNGWLVGDRLNIADIAAYTHVRRHDFVKVDLEPFPHLNSWLEKIGKIPGVEKGYAFDSLG